VAEAAAAGMEVDEDSSAPPSPVEDKTPPLPNSSEVKVVRRGRKPGRKGVKSDMKVKLERSRQSARECRARKKLRYQYLEDLVATREKAVAALYQELDQYQQMAADIDNGAVSDEMLKALEEREGEGTG